MKVENKLELKLEDFKKCHLVCDSDCALGELFDYSCALLNFVKEKIKESEQDKKEESQE